MKKALFFYYSISTILFSYILVNTIDPNLLNIIEQRISFYQLNTKNKITKKDSDISNKYLSFIRQSNYAPIDEMGNLDVFYSWKILKPKRKIKVAIIDTKINLKNIKTLSSYKSKISSFSFHGTHIASIVKAINPDIELISIPLVSNNATYDNTNEALRLAIKEKVDIINFSVGGNSTNPEELELIKKANKLGILIISASGNNGCKIPHKKYIPCSYYPAQYTNDFKNIISVSSINSNNKLSSNSNYGLGISDISSYGEKIKALVDFNKIKKISGTSQATAITTGIVSLALSHQIIHNPLTIKDKICNSSIKNQELRGKNRCSGIINAYNLIKSLN